MDKFTALYTSYLRFTPGTNSMHASPCAYRISGFVLAFLYKFMPFKFQVKDATATISHTQITWASLGPIEAYMSRSNSTSIIWLLDWLWEIRFSTILIGLKCLHAFLKSGFSRTNTINRFSLTSCKHTEWLCLTYSATACRNRESSNLCHSAVLWQMLQ